MTDRTLVDLSDSELEVLYRETSNKISRLNNLQLSKKLTLNSAYGAMGSVYFRFYDLRMAMAVTLSGQLSIRWIEEYINQYLNTVLKTNSVDYIIASDTDSVYVSLRQLIQKAFGSSTINDIDVDTLIEFMDRTCSTKLQGKIHEGYRELADYVNAYAQKMNMKREILANRGFWTAKKRYALNVYDDEGVRLKEPKLKVMGLDMIKSSTPKFVRETMRNAVKIIMKGSEDEVQRYISEFRTVFNKASPEDVAFPRGVNGIMKYSVPQNGKLYASGTPIHTRGAIVYNKSLKERGIDSVYEEISEGQKIKFVYLKLPNPVRENVISFPEKLPLELGLHDYIDYETQFEKCFLSPIRDILNVIGWQAENKNSVDSFFV